MAVAVEQCDRDAAADVLETLDTSEQRMDIIAHRVRVGELDDEPVVHAFAQHRLAASSSAPASTNCHGVGHTGCGLPTCVSCTSRPADEQLESALTRNRNLFNLVKRITGNLQEHRAALAAALTQDAYDSVCRALHYRTAQLRAHGIVPDTIASDAPAFPPDDYVFASVANLDPVKLPDRLSGHWGTPAGKDMALRSLDDPNMARNRERVSDFQLANEVYLSPNIGNLTAAKERIRWLSTHLAVAMIRCRKSGGELDVLSDMCAAMEYWAGCDEGVLPDVASSQIMSAGGAWPATAYDKARAVLAAQ